MINKPAAILSEEGLKILIEALTGLKSPVNAPNLDAIKRMTQTPEEDNDVDSEQVDAFLEDYKTSKLEIKQPDKKPVKKQKKYGKKSHQIEFDSLKEFMTGKGPIYLKSIWIHMNDLGIWNCSLKAASQKIGSVMKYFDEIEKTNRGMYEFISDHDYEIVAQKVGESDEA